MAKASPEDESSLIHFLSVSSGEVPISYPQVENKTAPWKKSSSFCPFFRTESPWWYFCFLLHSFLLCISVTTAILSPPNFISSGELKTHCFRFLWDFQGLAGDPTPGPGMLCPQEHMRLCSISLAHTQAFTILRLLILLRVSNLSDPGSIMDPSLQNTALSDHSKNYMCSLILSYVSFKFSSGSINVLRKWVSYSPVCVCSLSLPLLIKVEGYLARN